jgi:hypothetical protein
MLTVVNNPTFAGITEADRREDNYLPMQIFNKPVWDEFLFKQAKEYWLTFFLDKYMGKKDPIGADEWFWTEDGKWYQKQILVSATENPDGTFTAVLGSNQQYFVVTDIVDLGVLYPGYFGKNLMGRIEAVGTSGTSQTITFRLIDPQGTATGVITADTWDVEGGTEIALLYNSQGECFDAPEGRIHTPEKFYNYMTKQSKTYEICDDASNRTQWFKSSVTGRNYWVDEEEYQTVRHHKREVDNSILFGQEHTFTGPTQSGAGKGGRGMLPWLNYFSMVRTFAGAVVEDDFIEMMRILGNYAKGDTWLCIAGSRFLTDSTKALREYSMAGGVYFGKYGSADEVGLNYSSYSFNSLKMNFMHYKGFSDPDFLPANTNGVNYDNLAIFLQVGNDSIKTVYKKRREGGTIKSWLARYVGNTFNENGGMVSTTEACKKTIYTTHVGLEMKGLQSHGLMIGS